MTVGVEPRSRSALHHLPVEIRSNIFRMLLIDDEDLVIIQQPIQHGVTQVLGILLTCRLFNAETGRRLYEQKASHSTDFDAG